MHLISVAGDHPGFSTSISNPLQLFSVNLDRSINGSDEIKCRQEADSTSDQHKAHGHDECIPKVNHGADKLVHLKPCLKVEAAVQKNVYCRATTRSKGTPPPPIVFTRELEIRKRNGDFGRRRDQYYENQE